MCGIVGAYARHGLLPDTELFTKAMDRMRRRGPDDAGIWSDTQVRLGHRRLAVVDLGASGHQPMESADRRFVVVFNGEIYNHLELRHRLEPPGGWRGTCDTETLLEAYRAWGVDCLAHFNGMFAFAIWDRTEQLLFVARDRLGVKPLYYSWQGGIFSFASRPGALAAIQDNAHPTINSDALRAYLEFGYFPASLAFYANVQKLQQAHYMMVNESGPRIYRYWDYRHIAPDASLLDRREDDLVDELDELMRSAVRLRLLSDVPLGAFLSGGIDSALIVAGMKDAGVSDPKAYTISLREKALNEGPAAAATARHIEVNHVVETMDSQNLLDLLPTFIEEFDEPFADNSAFATMAVARLARRHVTVALTGDGGDELFGGYHYYPLLERLTRVVSWPRPIRQALRQALCFVPSRNARLLAGALKFDNSVLLFQYLRSLSKDVWPLVSDDFRASTSASSDWFAETAGCFSPDLSSAEIGMRLDTRFTLTDGYLQKVDLGTMAFSLEARCPFVDYRVVEWAMRLPQHYKIRDGQSKYILKRMLCRYLPGQLVYQPKRGFVLPMAAWLRGPLKTWASELLHDQSLTSQLSLDRDRLLRLFKMHASRARDAHPLLWAVLMALSFVAHHINGRSLPEISRSQVA
jgi:asparagine synthase (glutamine-hydrolysing)